MFSLLHHQTVRKHASQLWKFALVGGIGSTIDLSSSALFADALGIDPRIAVVLSSVVGATFVFFLNKYLTFKNREKKYGSQALKFVMVYGVAIVLNGLIANAFIFIGFHYLLAKVGAIGICAFWNYALSHGFIFKKGEAGDPVIV